MNKPETLDDKIQWLIENEGCELSDGYEALERFFNDCCYDDSSTTEAIREVLRPTIEEQFDVTWEEKEIRDAEEAESESFLDNAFSVEVSLIHLKQAMRDDSHYAHSWHDNVACMVMDAGVDHKVANDAASRVMRLCFGVETSWRGSE
jgi:hypothetical protein